MVTKLKKSNMPIWSIIALLIAAISIGYCLPHIIDLVNVGLERLERTVLYLTKLVKGSG